MPGGDFEFAQSERWAGLRRGEMVPKGRRSLRQLMHALFNGCEALHLCCWQDAPCNFRVLLLEFYLSEVLKQQLRQFWHDGGEPAGDCEVHLARLTVISCEGHAV